MSLSIFKDIAGSVVQRLSIALDLKPEDLLSDQKRLDGATLQPR